MTVSSAQTAPPYPGKSPNLISLGDGLNFSTPLVQVATGTRVPNPLFFLRSNYTPPPLEPQQWRVTIDGRVRHPLTVGLDDLRKLPSQRQEMWLECAGNSRRRWHPQGEGNQWDDQAVSNAQFTGVPLRSLLDQAHVEDDAIELVATGTDSSFQRSLPVNVARRADVLLAYEMNGQPIPWPNGGPVRLVVPGWAGIASVKWPARLELVNTPFKGYYNAERYIIVDASGQIVDTVREMPVKSVVAWPGEDEAIASGTHTVWGFAWSGHGEIDRVEVSADDQRTWSPARLTHGDGPRAWTRWEFDWTPASSGRASFAVRATDAAGNVQPLEAAWNKFGYLMNAILTRSVFVQA